MAYKLPPTPVGVPPGHSFWNDWYEKIRYIINEAQVEVTWSNINFTGSNLTSISTRNHNDLQSFQGGSAGSYFHLTGTQHTDLTDAGDSTLHFHSTDRSRANHTGTQTMSTISDLPTLSSGTYTPTLTSVANLDTTTSNVCQYLRVGNVVTVSGVIDVDPTVITTTTTVGISLPIASAFSAGSQCGGSSASATLNESGRIFADAVNDRAELSFVSQTTSNHTISIHFTYQII